MAWVFSDVEIDALLARLTPLGAGGVLLVLLPALGSGLVETAGWQRAFAMLGVRVSFGALFRLRMATDAPAQTLPAGVVLAESLKIALLKNGGLGLDAAVSGTLARKYLLMTSQSAYVWSAAILGFGALQTLCEHLTGHSGFAVLLAVSATLIGLAAAGMRSALSRGQVARRVQRLLRRLPSRRLQQVLAKSSWSASTDRCMERFFRLRPSQELAVTAPFLGAWLLESVETLTLLWLLGVPLEPSSVLAVEVLSSMLRMLAFVVPGGLGIQEAGYALFLHALAVPDATATGAAFAVLKRSKELVYVALGYCLLALQVRAPGARFRARRAPRVVVA
jgi:uncharacterized membrane protein YbhN (UPF0104 family)